MKCCQSLIDGQLEQLPFEKALAVGYYDGPTDGFTVCSQCGRAYSFRKLDWDELQDTRVFAFAPLSKTLEEICKRLAINFTDKKIILVPPLAELENEFVRQLLASSVTRITVFEGWPGTSSLWRDVSGMNLEKVNDWFSFLGIPKRHK